MDMLPLLTSIVGLGTATVGLVTAIVTNRRDLRKRKEKNPSSSQPKKDSENHH